MDQEAFDILVRKRQKLKKIPGKRWTEEMSQFVPRVNTPSDPLPPWHHIPEPEYAKNLVELKKQRDDFLNHSLDMHKAHHDMHKAHGAGTLPLGHGKYLLEIPKKIQELQSLHHMRTNQVTAVESYPKSKILKLYGISRNYQTDPSSSPSKAVAKKTKSQVDLVQMLVDDFGVNPDDLLTELAATT